MTQSFESPRTAGSDAVLDTVLDTLIIGSGFGGIGLGVKLRKAGLTSFLILERGDDVGGTWRDNNYPGCACDVQSHLYSFSFAPNPNWSRMFAPQGEIQQYLRDCAAKFELLQHVRFGQNVDSARYEAASGTWTVRTSQGDVYRTRALVSAIGAFSIPAYPKLEGLDRFQGKAFHSARWEHDYDLTGKRVAVIGTGASAIQFVPQLQRKVAQLQLFQRTAPWIIRKPDRAISDLERTLFRRLPFLQRLMRIAIYWMLEARVLGFVNPRLMKFVEREATRYMHGQIKDPVLRKKLTPTFTIGCKRILISNDYYPALAQPNVDVVTDAITEVREHSVVTADGREHPVDAIIYGTGFSVQQMLPRKLFFADDGRDLADIWYSEGVEAYKGTSVTGYPNLFMLVGPNTGLGHSSLVYIIESQVAYVVDALRRMRAEGWKSVQVKAQAQRAWNDRVQTTHASSVWLSGCKSWYLDARGKNTSLWPSFTFAFRKALHGFDADAYMIETASPAELQSRAATPPSPSQSERSGAPALT